MRKLTALIGALFVSVGVGSFLFFSGAAAGNTPATYFAQIDQNGNVVRVIVISQAQLNTGRWGDPSTWKQTSLDTSVTKNYAGTGKHYDATLNDFIFPKPSATSVLDPATDLWDVASSSSLINSATSTPL